jgi:alkylation response protein AidB-like acyl-CoA dehydrogenase
MTRSNDEQLILETVERLCASEITKYQNDMYYNTVPKALYASLSEVGLAGIAIPENLGGLEASAATTASIFETIARFDVGPAIFLSVHAMVSGLIVRFGTEEQKKGLLPKLASGELLAAFALTEPNAGSDARALTTEATQTPDGFKLKGSKCYITSAGFADLYLVFARTQTESGAEISAFLVPASTPELSIGKPEKKMGAELSPIASLFFEEAHIPRDALLGPINNGFTVATAGLAAGRVNIAACANGLSIAAFDIARRHLRERRQFGRPLADFQGLQFMIADMYQKLEAARLLTQMGAAEIDAAKSGSSNGVHTKLSSSVAKCFATDAAMSITTDAVQLLGGAGYIKEYSVERLMRDAKMLQIVEGANQVQRMIIARELLHG